MALFRPILLCILVTAFFISCSSNPAAPPASSGSIAKGDTARHALRITPDSSTAQPHSTVTFKISATPSPLPKPYTITWLVDTVRMFRTSLDTCSFTFNVSGKHSIKAVYVDSTGVARDSARTIITIMTRDTAIDTSTFALPSTLGSFKFVRNGDTLDRANVPSYCDAMASYYNEYFDGTPGNRIAIGFNYSSTQYSSRGDFGLTIWCGLTKGLVPATYAITSNADQTGCWASERSVDNWYSSVHASGYFTITNIDTVQNMMSGSFSVVVVETTPNNPNVFDTLKGTFRNVCFHSGLFGQGSMTATAGTLQFKPNPNRDDPTVDYIVGSDQLVVHCVELDATQQSLQLNVYAPAVGIFPLTWAIKSGTGFAQYSAGMDVYSNMYGGSGTLTITKFDTVARRMSGTFSFTAQTSSHQSITITNGVIDNMMFARE
ncbi:MAG: DUF6252 family protein [Bacteroidota bacterium]|nr:DUF6252 family protein [Bacteroidota bacterium]MDP4233210.1 DUF6252 family protein [Bacteroidota bacterium]MDP4242171.1 DUF6252 family protein [Bacteroidota bacterium]MDP4287821.1 DUF6252 family protein [Bacteroidota bacterium]